VLANAATPRLSELTRAFEQLTQLEATDGPAWFNLALARAWLGENEKALEALDRYLPLEADEARAETAAALAEVLRCGAGLEEQSDYAEYGFLHQFRDPQPVSLMLREWSQAERLVSFPVDEQNRAFVGMVLDFSGGSLVTAGGPVAKVGRMLGYVMVVQNLVRCWSPIKEGLDKLREEVRQKLNLAIGDAPVGRNQATFQDIAAEALIFPVREPAETARKRVQEHIQRHFEETWIHRPRRSLNGIAPVDAVGHPVLRKKLLGVIRFLQDCSAGGMIGSEYDFDRLRRKLGLSPGAAPPAAESRAPAASAAAPDIAAMGAAELSALKPEVLAEDQLEQAYQTAQRLDAGELATHFARALTARPPQAGKGDRFAPFSYLIQQALREGRHDEALDFVNEGERLDCEHNEGRRRDDYELRRGQVHVKRGEPDQAADVFSRLIGRVPANLRFRTGAAEAMLALKQGAKALTFAEEGLAVARQQQNRDAEQHLLELADAARRQKT
jgi:tetratricopeptide (TPR) repeat protein